MGIGPFRNCTVSLGGRVTSVCPNPKNFKIKVMVELENTYVEINYPDCSNYEGDKVMVFEGRVAERLLSSSEIDPHFSEGFSPLARFSPTAIGKSLAMQLAKGYGQKES